MYSSNLFLSKRSNFCIKYNIPILLFTTLLFVCSGIIGCFTYFIGVYSIWYPLQIQYSLYSPHSCNITGWTILTQPYEQSFLGTYYDNIEYLPIFNVTHSHISYCAYENVIHYPYVSFSDLNSTLQHYHIGLIVPCMIASPDYPVYFNYDINYIDVTLRNLLITSYFFICLSCLCLLFSTCYIFLYCTYYKRRPYSYVSI